ncbi:MAG: pseudoazurin [Moritella sp.]|uniref:pseudoazurin n=1 Tax=Moritella sp. TaxID=78556 RepID=UPI001DCAF66A|nr:pseudoazurin [Moritella sp.]NQZ51777.1 pseudoazurin [Moritella sp.]
MINRKILAVVALMACSATLQAAEHTVKLLTSSANGMMVMEPGYLKIASGDSVKFVPSDASHNASAYSVPTGAAKFNTPMGKTETVNFTNEGVYIYNCTPHLTLGMVGVIQVGSAVNIEQTNTAVAQLSTKIMMNKERLASYIAQIK